MKKSKKKKFLFNLYFVLPNFKLGKKSKEERGLGWNGARQKNNLVLIHYNKVINV